MMFEIAIGCVVGGCFYWWIQSTQEHVATAKSASNLVNWNYLEQPASEGIIRLKDGGLMASYCYKGKDLSGASEEQRNQFTHQLNNFLKDYGSGFGFYFSTLRYPTTGYTQTNHFPDAVTYSIDQARRERHNEEGQHYASSKYLSIIWKSEDGQESIEKFKAHLAELEDRVGQTLKLTRLNGSEHLTLLYKNMQGETQPITPPPHGDMIDGVLANKDIQVLPSFRGAGDLQKKLQIPSAYIIKSGDRFIRTLTIMGFPNQTYNGVLNQLNKLKCSYRWTTRIYTLDRESQVQKLKKARNSWRIRRKGLMDMISGASGSPDDQDQDVDEAYKDLSAVSKMKDTSFALKDINEQNTSFAAVTSTITLIGSDLEALNVQAARILKCVRQAGFTANMERFQSLGAWIGSLPGHSRNIRRTILSTLNIADILPTWAMWTGSQRNPSKLMDGASAHWQGKTIGNEPFRKHRPASGDVGHSMIIGSTGGGKSTYANFEVAQWLRHKDSQVFLFDKGYSGQLLCQAAGGTHYDLFSGGATSFQPLRDLTPETLKSTGYYADWIGDLFALQGVDLSAQDKDKIRKALRKVAGKPKQARTLSQFSFHLQDRHLKDTIRIYTRDGDYGNILDSSDTQLAGNRYQVFELGHLLDGSEKIVLPVLMHLFHKVETALDRTKPTLIIIEEAWSAFSNKHFQARLKNWLATLRKHNGHVCLIAHSPEQITSLPQSSMFVSNTPERVFLPNPDIVQPRVREHYKIFGLNEVQMDIIRNLTPKREYYVQTPAGSSAVDLELLPMSLAFIGNMSDLSMSSRQQKIHELQNEYGKRWPAEWLRFLGLTGQARRVEKNLNQTTAKDTDEVLL